MTIDKAWNFFKEKCIDPDTSEYHLGFYRTCFYSGFVEGIKTLEILITSNPETAKKNMEDIEKEILQYFEL